MNIVELTRQQPFCAGVALTEGRALLVTLNPDHLPKEWEGRAWCIGGVGGGQEPGETILECALREGREETNADVQVLSSSVTYFHDMDTGEIREMESTDEIKPFLLQRMTNPTPDTPYKPGLPVGPYIYFCLYLGRAEGCVLSPGDDVQGLLTVPLSQWSRLGTRPTLAEMLEAGAVLRESDPLPRENRLWIDDQESLSIIAKLFEKHPELCK